MTVYESTTTRLAREELGACTLIQDLLPLYIEGEVSPSSRDLIVEHLARCERCAGFLAGAQSVRGQLRRDTAQRAASNQLNVPAQRIVSRWQMLTTFIATITVCMIGSLSVVLIAQGLRGNNALFIGGWPILLFSMFLLGMLAKARGPITIERGMMLLGSCLAGAFASLLAFVSGNNLANLLGIMSGTGAMVGMWLAIWHAPQSGKPHIAAESLISEIKRFFRTCREHP